MKRLLFAVVLIVGCQSPSKPASIGMSVADYEATCVYGDVRYSSLEDLRVAECADKPNEYVRFNSGQATAILDSDGLYKEMHDRLCASQGPECGDRLRQLMAEKESQKAKISKEERQQDLAARFEALGNSGRAMSAASAGGMAPSAGMTCFFKTEAQSNMNKICYYDCLGSTYAQTQGAVSMCPLNINR